MASGPQVGATNPRLPSRAITAPQTQPSRKSAGTVRVNAVSAVDKMSAAQRRKLVQVVNEIVKVETPATSPRNARKFLPDWLKPYQKKWQKGQSGNPAGRPKRTKVSAAMKELAAEVEAETGLTYAELVALAMYYAAVNKGNVLAAKEIREATEGKLPETFTGDITVTDGTAAKQRLTAKLLNLPGTKVITETQTQTRVVTRVETEGNVIDAQQVSAPVLLPLRQISAGAEQR